MNFTVDIESYTLNKSPNFIRLIERIRQCIHEREITKEQQKNIKIYSTIHYIEHIKRYINDNPLIGQALFRFNNIIKNFPLQNNRFSSTILFDNKQSKLSLEEKISIDNLYNKINPKSDLSKISFQSTKSTTHYIQSTNISRQTNGLMTKATLAAINKAPRQRTTHDIEVLEHLLNHCESLRYLSADIRHYIARSLLLLTYQPNTILTRQNFPPFLVYIIVYGQCKLLLETNDKIILGHQLNIGDIYGNDSLQLIIDYHLNGLITNEINHCNLIGFFSRDIRAYENYLSDMMKQSLLEQFRIQSIFSTIQWRNDILNYFLKWSNYKQYTMDEIIYGNEEYEHENLYFILRGQVSFICLLDFPTIVIKHPEFSQFYQNLINQNIIKTEITPIKIADKNPSIIDNDSITSPLDISNYPSRTSSNLNFQKNLNAIVNEKIINKYSKSKITWRFLEIFILSNGHYFGFESTTIHSWYLTRSTVDIISIPKTRFKQFGYFAPMIFEKLRQDFLNIYPNENFIRNSYIKYLQMNNKSNENNISIIKFRNDKKQSIINNNHKNNFIQKINWIPEQTILSIIKKN